MSGTFGSMRRWLGRMLTGKPSNREPRVLADLGGRNSQTLPRSYEAILRTQLDVEKANRSPRRGDPAP
jgi:hypothetical protein